LKCPPPSWKKSMVLWGFTAGSMGGGGEDRRTGKGRKKEEGHGVSRVPLLQGKTELGPDEKKQLHKKKRNVP